jgi:hypothetical protein
VVQVFGCLLRQMVETQIAISPNIVALFDRHEKGRKSPSLKSLCDALHGEIASLKRAYIICDALDECSNVDGSQAQFLDTILQVQGAVDLNILATSRSIPEITKRFSNVPRCKIQADKGDVRLYLEAQTPRLPSFLIRNPALHEEMMQHILTSMNGM